MPGSYVHIQPRRVCDRLLTGEQEASSSKSSGGGLVHGFERGLVVVLRKSGGLGVVPGFFERDVTLADFRHGGRLFCGLRRRGCARSAGTADWYWI